MTAYGNVGVIADDLDQIKAYGGELSGGVVGVAASVAVLTLESDISAVIENSTVSAHGGTPPLSVPDLASADGSTTTTSASGVVVAARDQEGATVKALTAAGGLVAVPATVVDVQTATVTDAHIVGSQINSASNPGSGVLVHAAQATSIDGTIGTVAGGLVGVGAAVMVSTIENTTRAYISNEPGNEDHKGVPTGVYANTIAVSTVTYENVSVLTIGVAGGFVGVSGSVAYTKIDDTNDAFVRNSLLDAKNGAAGIKVVAIDNANISTTVVNAAAGFVGVGAAVGVSEIDNATRATLEGATLNANGAILVQAESFETIGDTVAGGSGGFVGVAASVLVDHINADTEATTETFGGQATLINQDPAYAGTPGRDGGSNQSVTIEASDNAALNGTVGAIAAGFVGAGAAIEVGGIADRTVAEVDAGTLINSAGDITVNATSQRNIQSLSFAGSGGLVALSGAFTVLSIGGAFDGQTASEVNGSAPDNSQQLQLFGEPERHPDAGQRHDRHQRHRRRG